MHSLVSGPPDGLDQRSGRPDAHRRRQPCSSRNRSATSFGGIFPPAGTASPADTAPSRTVGSSCSGPASGTCGDGK